MTTILHLSDLHLVDRARSPNNADEKSGLLHGTGATLFDTLRLSLESLARTLAADQRSLDAVVMSGDVAHQNDAGGYDAFLELLEALDPMKPAADRVVVVPGNHDVERGRVPGDGERYRRFVTSMRGAGFITPLLDGIDVLPTSGTLPERHLLRVGGLEIIPINSSGYSQIQLKTGIDAGFWAVMEKALNDAGADETTFKALRRLGMADAARIDESHLENLAKLLDASRAEWDSDPARWPVRIAVMHHQLLPVSVAEEVKPFEALTNLGQVRQFLREQDISVVLHGHKHQGYTYVDYVGSFDDVDAPPHPIRVVSGPALVRGAYDRRVIARLLSFDRAAGMLRVEAVPASDPGKKPRAFHSQRFPIVVPNGATTARTDGVTVIDADSVAALHARVLSLAEDNKVIFNLVARLGVSPEIEALAGLYTGFAQADPDAGDFDEAVHAAGQVSQFKELVEWWQNPVPIGGEAERSFTHGNRIFRYQGHVDQFEDLALAIENNPDTTRSILVLLQPGADRVAEPEHEFPSFCLAQFGFRMPEGGGERRLDCVAYFRKLELRYWWVVNLAELARLQRKLIERLVDGPPGKRSSFDDLEPGSITTVAARAHAGQSPVSVQIPAIDRYYAVGRERLQAMVHALVWDHIPGRDQHGEEWMRLLQELIPPARRQEGRAWVAIEGLRFLRDEVARLSNARPGDAGLGILTSTLSELLALNEAFANDERHHDVSAKRYAARRKDVTRLVAQAMAYSGARILTPAGVDKSE
jgi:3',5'-cyclic AMP phosphodiesterase CpdA